MASLGSMMPGPKRSAWPNAIRRSGVSGRPPATNTVNNIATPLSGDQDRPDRPPTQGSAAKETLSYLSSGRPAAPRIVNRSLSVRLPVHRIVSRSLSVRLPVHRIRSRLSSGRRPAHRILSRPSSGRRPVDGIVGRPLSGRAVLRPARGRGSSGWLEGAGQRA